MSENKNHDDAKPNIILDDEKNLLLDHEYDGIQELDNPMPPWWLYGFYFTIALAVVYMLYYEVFRIGPNQLEEYQQEMAAAAERFGLDAEPEVTINYADLEILTDESSITAGRQIYAAPNNLCTTCHGQNAQGLVGPDLTNNLWKHGCDLESIMISIKEGFPSRGMPAYGSGQRLSDDQLHQLASYIISLRGSNPDNAKAADMSRSIECEI
ncbi:MAG: c-type cytochrome [Balneolales bacterium]|nr:c-type cytochrome [Balneolales bacterium]